MGTLENGLSKKQTLEQILVLDYAVPETSLCTFGTH